MLLLAGCAGQASMLTMHEASDQDAATPIAAVEVTERWLTQRNEQDNVDSVAVWTDGVDRHWLLATAKESDILIIYDAATGERLGQAGGTGNASGELLRPNGIMVLGNMAWIVERDNHRLQVLSLPDFEPLGIFGQDLLSKPYGLWIHKVAEGYRVFITDSYETADEQVPPDAELDRRLHRFDINAQDGLLSLVSHQVLGPVEGKGRLLKVESLWGDPDNDRLLVADEHETHLNVKLFDIEGGYTGQTLLDGDLFYEPEGIALERCQDGSGYWIVTDQDMDDNRFLILQRQSMEVLAAFTGIETRNTDGVWLHPKPLPGFPGGVFYAVHDDGNVAAFDWAEVQATLNLEPCSAVKP